MFEYVRELFRDDEVTEEQRATIESALLEHIATLIDIDNVRGTSAPRTHVQRIAHPASPCSVAAAA